MNNFFRLLVFIFLIPLNSRGQQIIFSGTIEYECRVNIHKVMQEESPEWYEMTKDRIPKLSIIFNNLTFDTLKSIYYPGKEPEQKPPFWGDEGVPDSYIYSDFKVQQLVAQKEVFDQTFLIRDSVRSIQWKISNETRDIAGISCKKATAIIMDSIYVIAFFTDRIVCPGGPESINGLPGMILGMVVPRLHSTWFATKIEPLTAIDAKKILPPKKGKLSTLKEMRKKLEETFKEWGKSYVISFQI
ncbi:MAG: GLPGLI family protein [Bacteroidetes bacterium]|nr:GLPGLI family protein [Bacteroidota bacterium]